MKKLLLIIILAAVIIEGIKGIREDSGTRFPNVLRFLWPLCPMRNAHIHVRAAGELVCVRYAMEKVHTTTGYGLSLIHILCSMFEGNEGLQNERMAGLGLPPSPQKHFETRADISVYGMSLQGSSHIERGQPCQDYSDFRFIS